MTVGKPPSPNELIRFFCSEYHTHDEPTAERLIPRILTTQKLSRFYSKIKCLHAHELFKTKYLKQSCKAPSISRGVYGTIRKIQDFIIKWNKETTFSERETAKREIRTLEEIRQNKIPHCAEQIDFYSSCFPFHYSIQKNAGPSLHSFINNLRSTRQQVDIFTMKSIFFQLMKALAGLEKIQRGHFDLKPDNICLDPYTGRLTVIDFGLSDKYPFPFTKDQTLCTLWYRSPEETVFGRPTPEFDIWSAACVIVELITQSPLFPVNPDGPNPNLDLLNSHFDRLISDKRRGSRCFEQLPEEMKRLLRNRNFLNAKDILKQSSSSRVRLQPLNEKLAKSAFIQNIPPETRESILESLTDLLTRMLEFDPTKRIKAKEALKHPFFSKSICTLFIIPGNVPREYEQARLEILDGNGTLRCSTQLSQINKDIPYYLPEINGKFFIQITTPDCPENKQIKEYNLPDLSVCKIQLYSPQEIPDSEKNPPVLLRPTAQRKQTMLSTAAPVNRPCPSNYKPSKQTAFSLPAPRTPPLPSITYPTSRHPYPLPLYELSRDVVRRQHLKKHGYSPLRDADITRSALRRLILSKETAQLSTDSHPFPGCVIPLRQGLTSREKLSPCPKFSPQLGPSPSQQIPPLFNCPIPEKPTNISNRLPPLSDRIIRCAAETNFSACRAPTCNAIPKRPQASVQAKNNAQRRFTRGYATAQLAPLSNSAVHPIPPSLLDCAIPPRQPRSTTHSRAAAQLLKHKKRCIQLNSTPSQTAPVPQTQTSYSQQLNHPNGRPPYPSLQDCAVPPEFRRPSRVRKPLKKPPNSEQVNTRGFNYKATKPKAPSLQDCAIPPEFRRSTNRALKGKVAPNPSFGSRQIGAKRVAARGVLPNRRVHRDHSRLPPLPSSKIPKKPHSSICPQNNRAPQDNPTRAGQQLLDCRIEPKSPEIPSKL